LHLALKAGNVGLYDIDLASGGVTVSPEYASMLGYASEHFRETART
jgi:PAS domain-containing protein